MELNCPSAKKKGILTMSIKKVFVWFLAMLLLTTALTGYKNGNVAAAAENTAATRTDLIYSLRAEPTSLDPAQCSDLVAFQVMHQVFDTIVIYQTDGSITPGIAKEWELLDDGMRYRFYLRDDVQFHNGDMLVAEDVVFSWNRLIASSFARLVTGSFDHAEKVDDYTVDLFMKNPFGPTMYCLGNMHMAIYSKRAVEEMGDDAFGRTPIASGPYKVVSWQSGDSVVLTANENYWRGTPTIKDITFKIITDLSAAAIALEKGEIDFIYQPNTADKKHLMSLDQVAYYSMPQIGTTHILMKLDRGYFTDLNVRKAIDYAIERNVVIAGALDGNGIALYNPCHPDIFGYDPDIVTREYSIEKAKECMAASAYPDGFSVTMCVSEQAVFSKTADILQAQLKEIGINIELEKVERGVWLQRVATGGGKYEISVASLLGNYPDWDYHHLIFNSKLDKYSTGINDTVLDELMDTGKVSVDETIRKAAYSQAQQRIVDNAYIIPLFAIMEEAAANANLKGVIPSPISRFYVFDWSW
jgi:peptide/nickel transport system substrate-binding protein